MSKNQQRSRTFRATRQHHDTEAAEDYTELAADLIQANGEARIGQIAEHLGISHVTAVRTMQRLKREGYFQSGTHRPIALTRKGKKLAEYAKRRHQLLVEFLISIGVPQHQAEVDVEGAEHHFSSVTVRYIKKFLSKRTR